MFTKIFCRDWVRTIGAGPTYHLQALVEMIKQNIKEGTWMKADGAWHPDEFRLEKNLDFNWKPDSTDKALCVGLSLGPRSTILGIRNSDMAMV